MTSSTSSFEFLLFLILLWSLLILSLPNDIHPFLTSFRNIVISFEIGLNQQPINLRFINNLLNIFTLRFRTKPLDRSPRFQCADMHAFSSKFLK